MDKDEIRRKVLDELTALQKEFNIPQIEIDKAVLQFEDLIPLLKDKDELLQQLADDLIDSVKYRANIGIPDTIPDELIVEDIAKQEEAAKFPLKKIISGMQKNVDQYGIEAAKVLGLDYGGTVNQGFKVVPEGSNSPNFQEFVDSGKWEEIESQYYPDRTKANAQNADGTVWFGEGDSKGYGATKNYSGNKPWIENPTDVELRQWIIDNNIQTLNVAGNRSYGTEELGQEAMNTIIKAVDPNKLPPQGGSLGSAKFTDDFFDPNVGKITSLPDNHIFVFGSNTAGRHGKGAALDAKNNFGAITGQGYGLQGQSFAIPTKDGDLNVLDNKQIQGYINKFFEFAKNNPNKTFVFTDIGTGLAGKNTNEITSMLSNKPDNVILSKRFSNGGSLGAAKLNDPNIFPEKIEEYDPDIHKSFKESILDKMTDSERKALDYINNHPTMQNAKLNGESLLLGLVKTFGADVFDKYNSLSKFNPVKISGKLSKVFYRGIISILDPIGEGIETAVKIGVKAGTIKDAVKGRHAMGDSLLKAANQGRKAAKGAKATGALTGRLGGIASNLKYELYNQLVWQGTAAVVAGIDNASDALNSVLDEYGLLPKFVKENIDVIPYEDLNKHLAHQSRYWQSAGWQGSKLTSLWYILDTMLPAKTTGNTPHNWGINKMVMSQFPQRFELDADEEDYWNIISGQREFKIKNQDGFFGWWKNEIEQTGQFGVEPSYFAQVNNPDLNIYNANSHVDTWKKLQKIKDRFGPGIMEMAGYDIQMYDNAESGS